MNYDQYIDRLKDLAGFAVWISLLLVPALAAVKKHMPTMKGRRTLATALVMGCCITGALVVPDTLAKTFDCLLIGFMAGVIAVGGDSYLFRVVSKLKGSPPLPFKNPEGDSKE